MTSKQKEILKAASDLWISQLSQSINGAKPELKEKLRASLKESIEAGESLDEIKTKD